MRRLSHAIASITILIPGLGFAQTLGDTAAGERLATAWCSECHLLGPDRIQVSAAKPPSFATIAARPEVTPLWLAAFFLTPHPVMPNIVLQAGERDDISAYVLSLKPRR